MLTDIVTTRDIGAIIRKRRKELGLSQEQLSEKVGVSYQQIQRYENGGSMLNVENVQRIAKALDMPVHIFFTEVVSARIVDSDQYPSTNEKSLLKNFRNIDFESDKQLAIKLIRRLAKKV